MSNQGWTRILDDHPVDLANVLKEENKDIKEPYSTKK